jgi:predicted DNA-binding transcriptional regulator AlpA
MQTYYTAKDAAKVIGVTQVTFYRWKKEGLSPPQRAPRAAIWAEDLQEWLDRREAHRRLSGEPLNRPLSETELAKWAGQTRAQVIVDRVLGRAGQ